MPAATTAKPLGSGRFAFQDGQTILAPLRGIFAHESSDVQYGNVANEAAAAIKGRRWRS